MADILEEGVKMSDLTIVDKETHSIEGLDEDDLNLLILGLIHIIGDLEQHDLVRAAGLIEVMR